MHLDQIVQQLKERRVSLNVTQEMLSDVSGVSLRALKQLESGKGNPTLATLNRLCEALGLELGLKLRGKNFE